MSALRAVTLVATREIRERLRSRTFLVSTIVLLLLVGGATALNGALSGETTYRVGLTARPAAGLDAALQRAAQPFDAGVKLRVYGSRAAGREALRGDDVDALLLLGEDRLVFLDKTDPELGAIAESAVRGLRRHLPAAPELTTASLEPPGTEPTDAETVVAVTAALLLLGTIVVYGQWVVSGVVEEKHSRVAEVLLSMLRAQHLLAGKVIGIGLLGFAQILAVVGLAAALLAAGAFDAPKALGANLVLVVPWFALGYALYAVAYAAAGALASREQDADTAGQPVSYTLLAAYFAGYAAVSADPDGTLANVLTVFPPTAPLVLPARNALVGVPTWEHVLAIVLVLATIYATVRFAGRVYAHGLLHAGPRLGARAAWRPTRPR